MINQRFQVKLDEGPRKHITKRMAELGLRKRPQYFMWLLHLDGYEIQPKDL